LNDISELHGVQQRLVFVFDVNAVMEHNTALLFDQFSSERPGLTGGMRYRSLQIGQHKAFKVRYVEIVV
jgi:hypothetical protein